jgi:predicted permease
MKKVLKFVGCTALILLAFPVVILVVGIASNLLGSEDFSKVGAFVIVALMAIFVLMVVRLARSKGNTHGQVSGYCDAREDERRVKAHWEEGYYPSTDGSGTRWDGLPE